MFSCYGNPYYFPKSQRRGIFSDSRSALQHHSGWSSANDEPSVFILVKLGKISEIHYVHLQWVPSYVNIEGNENVERDGLYKEGSVNEIATGTSLTYQELYPNATCKLNLI
ncbi:hypothetical protein TNIN_315811 [Trichonephila inaurata madagascariensis]|uniref:Uncharacterized protein n=1 Tax=Trichonephila inaurata madagascariensis TaxID=2747483 RepID=A0A8X6XFI0_9ARAC|nr:hypothetical protein TNIN_315811 [Trichonephila inaurata madagascariensis]